jgi:hypothetical protein
MVPPGKMARARLIEQMLVFRPYTANRELIAES